MNATNILNIIALPAKKPHKRSTENGTAWECQSDELEYKLVFEFRYQQLCKDTCPSIKSRTKITFKKEKKKTRHGIP